MRISLLNNREPFRDILIATLKRFLEKDDPDAKIFRVKKFTPDFFRYLNSSLFENKYLNFYAGLNIHKNRFDVLVQEYGSGHKQGLRILQCLYVLFAVSKPGRVICSTSVLVTDTSSKRLNGTILLGGNHRLRILEPDKKETTVLLKKGFRTFWIQKETGFRKKLNPGCAPGLIKVSSDGLSFTEEYTPGTPINRLPGAQRIDYANQAAERLQSELTGPTHRKEPFPEWYESKIKRVEEDFISGFRGDPGPELKTALMNVLDIFRASPGESAADAHVNLAVSHGDFQYANILLKDDGELVCIDWESMDKRWFAYDMFTLFLESRRYGYIDYNHFTAEIKSNEMLQKLLKECSFDENTMFLIFSLEELHYRVLDTCEPVFYNPGDGLAAYLNKTEPGLRSISK